MKIWEFETSHSEAYQNEEAFFRIKDFLHNSERKRNHYGFGFGYKTTSSISAALGVNFLFIIFLQVSYFSVKHREIITNAQQSNIMN